jgi:single-stranded DNA-specific DHH superfamily exonuclease
MSKYKRPVILLSKTVNNEQDAWEGSARGYEKSKLNDFRQFVRDSNLVFLAEGHANAFGFGIYEKDFEDFITWSDNQLKDIEFSPSYKVDFIYSMSDINSKDILELGNSKYLWG